MKKIYLTDEERRKVANRRYNEWAHKHPEAISAKNRRYYLKRKARKAAAEAENNVNERED